MHILDKINDIGNRLSEQRWDELSKYKMSISGPDVEWIITGLKYIGDYKVRFSFSITEHSKRQALKIILLNRYSIGTVCIYEKTIVCNNRAINSAIEKLNAVLEAFSENYHETGQYKCGGAIVLKRNGMDRVEVINVSKLLHSEKEVINLLMDMASSSLDLREFIKNKTDYLNY